MNSKSREEAIPLILNGSNLEPNSIFAPNFLAPYDAKHFLIKSPGHTFFFFEKPRPRVDEMMWSSPEKFASEIPIFLKPKNRVQLEQLLSHCLGIRCDLGFLKWSNEWPSILSLFGTNMNIILRNIQNLRSHILLAEYQEGGFGFARVTLKPMFGWDSVLIHEAVTDSHLDSNESKNYRKNLVSFPKPSVSVAFYLFRFEPIIVENFIAKDNLSLQNLFLVYQERLKYNIIGKSAVRIRSSF